MEMITALIVVFFTAFITNNIILNAGYGLCSYIGVSQKKSSAIGMGFALVFVVMMASLVSFFLDKLLVLLEIEFMRTVCFILVIASLVQLVEMIVKKFFPALYNSLGIYLPLITTNCVVLYVTKQICDVPLLISNMGVDKALADSFIFEFIFALVYAFGSGLGYFAVIFLFSTIREKLDHAPLPKGFAGAGIAMLTTAILALAVAGLAGIV